MRQRQTTREISYATSARSRSGRALIRVLENFTGRLGLIRRAKGYEHEMAAGKVFWDVIVERYGLSLEVVGGSLANIPTNGPLILIANHPYGILDGLMMGHIMSQVRGDFRILANSVFRRAEDLNRVLLPISFDESKEALHGNVKTIRQAVSYVRSGGAIGMFPGGTVATSRTFFGQAAEPVWPSTVGSIVGAANPVCVPVFFHGSTSRLFQISSHLHSNLRLSLLINEFKKSIDSPVRISIGEPLVINRSPKLSDSKSVTSFLREAVCSVGGVDANTFGKQYLKVGS